MLSRKFSKKLSFCIITGLLMVQWLGVTHAHDSEIDVDRICSICLVGENLSHGIVPSIAVNNVNGIFASRDNFSNTQNPQVSFYYYLSRAPPVYL